MIITILLKYSDTKIVDKCEEMNGTFGMSRKREKMGGGRWSFPSEFRSSASFGIPVRGTKVLICNERKDGCQKII